jgi:hypothetical protein
MRMVRWWVDGSFAVHPDMKSHTGSRVMSLGKGARYAASKRQKLNTRSSTEELFQVQVGPAILFCDWIFGWGEIGTREIHICFVGNVLVFD